MAPKAKNDKKKVEYRSFEEFRKKFYQSAQADKSQNDESDGSASFGKQVAKELVRRK
jgi:hypothetical protein